MNVINRTFVGAHFSILQQCLERGDEPLLVARCGRGFLLLTRRRLVVTGRSGLLQGRCLRLNAALRRLSNLSWSVDDRHSALVVNLTAVDGVREQLVVRLGDHTQATEAEALFRDVVLRKEDFAAAA
jgi:hypothetical protein